MFKMILQPLMMLIISRLVNIFATDSHCDSVRLSVGIAEQCARQEKILKFLMSGSDVKELCRYPAAGIPTLTAGKQDPRSYP
jgi:hypothetical protein